MLVVLSALAVLVTSQAPSAEEIAKADAIRTRVTALNRTTAELTARHVRAKQALTAAGVVNEENRDWSWKQPPTREQTASLSTEWKAIEADAKRAEATCSEVTEVLRQANFTGEEEDCRRYFESMHQRPKNCEAWKKFDGLRYRATTQDCDLAISPVLSDSSKFERARQSWENDLKRSEAAAALDAVHLQPVSGNVKQRAIPLPSRYVRTVGNSHSTDTLALFANTHPSHFVFLRKPISEAPRYAPDESQVTLARTLKKGEAVLVFPSNYERHISFTSIDGLGGFVKIDDLAVAPLPGTKPVALTAADLNVLDAQGKVLAGPTWLLADATGFSLDEPNGWLDLLDPAEPRQQQFYDAKEKVLGCYQKQMSKLDPNGRLSRYYDVVTYGRAGIVKVESAAVNFDRKACAACGCKAFNDKKRKLIEAAIKPAQKQRFETSFKPIVDKLSTTDFANASKGAAAGADTGNSDPY